MTIQTAKNKIKEAVTGAGKDKENSLASKDLGLETFNQVRRKLSSISDRQKLSDWYVSNYS